MWLLVLMVHLNCYLILSNLFYYLMFIISLYRGNYWQHCNAGPGAHTLQWGHHDYRSVSYSWGISQRCRIQTQVSCHRGGMCSLLSGRSNIHKLKKLYVVTYKNILLLLCSSLTTRGMRWQPVSPKLALKQRWSQTLPYLRSCLVWIRYEMHQMILKRSWHEHVHQRARPRLSSGHHRYADSSGEWGTEGC